MKKFLLVLIAALMLGVSPAFALFTNGGFETGNFDGWTVEHGRSDYNDYSAIVWGPTPRQYAGVVESTNEGFTPGGTLPDSVAAYNGTYMAKIGDLAGGYNATRIYQTGYVTAQDILDGGLYVNWGAVLNDPSHPVADQPYFGISVNLAGSITTFQADATNLQGGSWINVGGNNWYKSDTWSFDLTGASVGDAVTVSLFVADCGYGGHGAYALLDGIGTTYQPPGGEVPEPATMILFGLGLLGLAGVSRKK
jgi:hypothetical protein